MNGKESASVSNLAYLMKNQVGAAIESKDYGNNLFVGKVTNKQRKQLQHEFKIHREKYGKQLIGKGTKFIKVSIWDDVVLFRGKGFLTEPEKQIVKTPGGSELVNAARMQHAHQAMNDNALYVEGKIDAKCIDQTYQIDSLNDKWVHLMIFDQILIELNKD